MVAPRTERGRRTRAGILAAAEAVFGELGYDKASITGITQAAGIAQGTFYVHFDSKLAVFTELVSDFAVRVRQRMAGAVHQLPRERTRADVEMAGLEAFFEYTLEHPALYRVVREAQFVAPEAYREYFTSFIGAYVGGFRRLTPGVPAGLDVEPLGWALVGMADTFGLRYVIWEGRLPPAHAIAQIRALLEAGLPGALIAET